MQVLTELLKTSMQTAPVQRKALDLVADLAGRGIELQVSPLLPTSGHGHHIHLLLPNVLLNPAAMKFLSSTVLPTPTGHSQADKALACFGSILVLLF